MAKGGKARTVIVRLISTAQTGFFYTTKRVRLNSPKLSAVKYDPVVRQRVLLDERENPLSLPETSMAYTIELNRTHLLFVPPQDPQNASRGTVVQVCLRGDPGEGNISTVFSEAQASITVRVLATWRRRIQREQKTIETLLVCHVNGLRTLPECVIVKEVVAGYSLIGARKPWTYGRGKLFFHGEAALWPAEHKWVFRFEGCM